VKTFNRVSTKLRVLLGGKEKRWKGVRQRKVDQLFKLRRVKTAKKRLALRFREKRRKVLWNECFKGEGL